MLELRVGQRQALHSVDARDTDAAELAEGFGGIVFLRKQGAASLPRILKSVGRPRGTHEAEIGEKGFFLVEIGRLQTDIGEIADFETLQRILHYRRAVCRARAACI